MSTQGKNKTEKVVPIKPNKPTSPTKVEPEDGWKLQSPYGTLLDVELRPLERLEAVHALLMEREGLTSNDAAVRVFSPFVSDTNSEIGVQFGADKLRRYLMVCDRSDRAYSLFPVSRYSNRAWLDRIAEQLPYVPHHRFDNGTPEALLYALAQVAGEVWAPGSGDFDLNDRLCQSFADGYFPSVDKAREILGPIAVRHDLAHKLWGWGCVKANQIEVTPASEKPSASWNEVVCIKKADKGAALSQDQKRAIAVEFDRRSKLPGANGVAKAMACELGISVTAFNGLKKGANEAGKREEKNKRAAFG